MWRDVAVYTEEERDVLEFSEQMTATPVEVDDVLFDRLKARYSPAAMVELTTTIAWENFRARFDHAMGVESQDFVQDGVKPEPAGAAH